MHLYISKISEKGYTIVSILTHSFSGELYSLALLTADAQSCGSKEISDHMEFKSDQLQHYHNTRNVYNISVWPKPGKTKGQKDCQIREVIEKHL